MNKNPDVSFIVAAHNVAPFIEVAVNSALCQSDVEVEVIVIDDCSSDATNDIVRAIAVQDERVRLLTNSVNQGPSDARNRGFAEAKGDWIAILDGDDEMEPGRTRKLLSVANATSSQIVSDNWERINLDGSRTGRTLFPPGRQPYSFQVDVASFLFANPMLGKAKLGLGAIKPMFCRQFMMQKNVSFQSDVPVGEDFHLILESLLAGGRLTMFSTPFYKYRIRPGSQSWRLKPGQLDLLLKAHQRSKVSQLARSDERIRRAADSYERSLRRAARFQRAVEHLKRRQLRAGIVNILRDTSIWGLVMHHGAATVSNRFRRLVGS